MVKRYFQIMLVFAVAMLFTANTSLFSQSWTTQTSGTINILEATWFWDAQNGWAVGNSGTSIFTTNGGQDWNSVILTNEDLKGVAFLDQSTGLIVGDNGRIFRTTNGGTNWSQVGSGTNSNILAVAFGEGGMVYAGGRDGLIIRSSDSGASWTGVETGTTRYRGAAAVDSLYAWVVGDEGKIRATTDGGNIWTDQASGTSSDLHDVFFLTATEGWLAGQNDLLLYTNDGGASWSSRNSGITVGLEAVYFLNSNDGWAVGNTGQIFITINSGINWIPESSGTAVELNDVFFVNADNGWVVGDNGTILYRNNPTGINEDNVDSPTEFSLEQNYPNPFNPITNIEFELNKDGVIELVVYDVQGKNVATLLNERKSKGKHSVVFNATSLASGVYYYKLKTKGFVETKKMLLVK